MLSKKALYIINKLGESGYDAYAVGGCVRDMLRGAVPLDFDITTSARPDEIKRVFADESCVDTGIAHGTVTVIIDHEPFEVTTFRTDGEYKDSRHPESVSFASTVEDDLSRRDFTVNSMAMSADGKITDLFGGMEDLKNSVIRCTGEPDKRFGEDALRIMRALRFASVLDFEIEKETAASIHRKKELLLAISHERIFAELKKLLCGKAVFRVLTQFSDVICTVIPELLPSVNFDQKNKYHIYDVYTHTAKAVENAPDDETVRLAMLFHDSGKPQCMTEDADGTRHFFGHPEVSAEIAAEVLGRLRSDTATRERVSLLCKLHDHNIVPTERAVKRLFMKLSFEEILQLCQVRIADNLAQSPLYPDKAEEAAEIMRIAEKIVVENQCVSLRELHINGNDLKRLGFKGKEIGSVLSRLLEKVIDGELENEKEALLFAAINTD